jgi:hypothetical protein
MEIYGVVGWGEFGVYVYVGGGEAREGSKEDVPK